MYKQNPIFPQKSDEKKKTYLHRLLGRMKRLKKMIVRRNKEVLPNYQSEIDRIDLDILKLQKKKEKWLNRIKETHTEMDEVRLELTTYLKKVEPMLLDRDISPTFQIRELPRKLKSGKKIYFEGRVRGRMIRGYRSRDYTYPFGDETKVRETILKEFGVDTKTINRYERDKYLEKLLKQYWMEDIGTTNL
jgi:hypothetical protein